ncbi:MAG: class I SAM-dependent methyltransferase [Candidatus Rokubacteria bacterium]|nr:class I SAM-dependent methyltransferase [Candidatus Rokubacteria bacterium]
MAKTANGAEYTVCNLCGADEGEPLFTSPDLHLGGLERFEMVRCRRCGLIYLNPRPGGERLADFYPDDYAVFQEDRWSLGVRVRRLHVRLRAAWLGRLLPRGGRVLEIGCGRGELLTALRDRGLEVEGVDLSPQAVRMASRSGIRVVQGTILTAGFAEESYDLIVMAQVLEHIPDPLGTLQRVRALLRPKGWLYIEVPNAGSFESRLFGRYWGGWDVPRHLYGFSPTTLAALVERAGLSLHRMHFLASPTTGVWGIVNLLRYSKLQALLLRHGREKAVRVVTRLLLWPWYLCARAAGQSGIFAAVCQKT